MCCRPEVNDVLSAVTYERKREQIETEAALDGLYVLRTTCPPEQNCQARRSSGSTSN